MSSKYHIDLNDYGISKSEEKELKYFCLAYPDKKRKLESVYSPKSPNLTGMPSGSDGTSPTEKQAEIAISLKKDIDIIEKAVAIACGKDTGMVVPLLLNMTEDIPLKCQMKKIPCGIKQVYEYRRRAFYYLYQLKNKIG